MANLDAFDAYFRSADLDRDGRISGREAVTFFQGANLPKPVLAKIWQYADQGQTGFLSRAEFFNALKLVTVAQTGRELTPDIVRAALAGPASSQIPVPRIASPSGPPVAPQPQAYRFPASGGLGPNAQPYQHVVATTNQLPMPLQSSIPRPNASTGPPMPGLAISGAPAIVSPSEISNKPLMSAQSLPAPSTNAAAPGLLAKATALSTSQPSPDPFGKSTFQAGSDGFFNDGPKNLVLTGPRPSMGSPFGGEVFAATPATSTVASSEPKSTMSVQTVQHFGNGALQPGLGPLALVPTSVPLTTATKQIQSVPRQAAIGLTPTVTPAAQWTKLTHSDVQRYTKVFMEVDTDRDGKITGDQARELFLSWRLPREILKKIWDLSDQDHDSKLSLQEFCTALYLMERFREGRTLPAVLPSGVLLDESAVAALRVVEAQAIVAQHSAGINVPVWQQNPSVLQRPAQTMPTGTIQPVLHSAALGQVPGRVQIPTGDGIDTAALGQPKSRAPISELIGGQLSTDDQQMLKTKHKEAEKAERKVQEMEKDIMDSKEKMEFYRSKSQEIILFKTRCDNHLAEIIERAAADKREVESLAKRYDEKFKQAGETNSRLLAAEANFRDIQGRKLELYNALVGIEQGGNTNALLQSRADHIRSDLDEMRKALNEKCKRLGLSIKPTALIELPYGWQPGIQENAAEWDEEWDKFSDEGFSAVQNLVDEAMAASFATKQNTTASWDDHNLYEEGFDSSSPGNREFKRQADDLPAGIEHTGAVSVGPDSEDGSFRSETESPRHGISTSSPKQGGKDTLENSSSNKESNEQRATSSNSESDIYADDGGAWASVFSAKNEEENADVRASWELQSSPPRAKVSSGGVSQTAQGSQFVTSFTVGDSFDMLSSPVGAYERDQEDYRSFGPIRTKEKASISFDNSVPSTPLFSVASPARPSGAEIFDENSHGQDQFIRFDSFSISHNTSRNMGRENFSRFDSFSSVQDATHSGGFASFDESDPFAGTGPFAAAGRTPSHSTTDVWNAFI
eukprot:c27837_g1_i1 orf=197-3274(+)